MPIYEYICEQGHIVEKIVSIADRENTIKCKECAVDLHLMNNMELTWSQPANISIGKPTIVFRNTQTGDLMTATHEFQSTPYGCIKEELRNPFERTKYEKELNTKLNAEEEVRHEIRQMQVNAGRKQRHDNLKATMNALQKEHVPDARNPEKTIKVEYHHDNVTKDLLKRAMEHSSKKELPKKKSNFILPVNHRNSSNIDK